jgi:hypothetical protein
MAILTRKSRERCVTGSRTLAQVKAGSYILPPFGGAYIITGGWLRAVGADCATATSVNIDDDTPTTQIVGVAVAVGPLDDGVVYDFDAAASVTRTTYGAEFKYGRGLQIIDRTKGTLTGPTTIDFCVKYMKVSG